MVENSRCRNLYGAGWYILLPMCEIVACFGRYYIADAISVDKYANRGCGFQEETRT